jgi:hypothetical protein
MDHLDAPAGRVKDVPEAEIDAALDEAMQRQLLVRATKRSDARSKSLAESSRIPILSDLKKPLPRSWLPSVQEPNHRPSNPLPSARRVSSTLRHPA